MYGKDERKGWERGQTEGRYQCQRFAETDAEETLQRLVLITQTLQKLVLTDTLQKWYWQRPYKNWYR